MDADPILDPVLSVLRAALPDVGYEPASSLDRPTIVVPRERLVETGRVLRDSPALRFEVLTEVTAVDWWPAEPRFEVVYHLLSPGERQLLRLVVRLAGDDPHVPTLSGVWPSAGLGAHGLPASIID